MRFLHLADVHLDTPFRGRSRALRDRLRESSREAFRRAVDTAIDREVHAVLVAGDLLDGRRLSFATERFLLDELERLDEAGIQLIYATGNHDPGRAGHRVHRIGWPERAAVVRSRTPVTIPVHDEAGRLVGRVTAAGHETARESEDLAAGFPPAGDDVPEVALLHAQVVGSRASEAHDRYAPTELATLRRSGYRYWALGHVHLRQSLSEDPAIHYPGNPQGRHQGETGPKGALLVELPPGESAVVEFVELGPVRWEELTVDGLEDAHTLEEIERAVRATWAEEKEARGGSRRTEYMVRVRLRGGCPIWHLLGEKEERETLGGELRGALGALDVEVRSESVHPVVDPDEHRERRDVVGEALRLLDDVRAGRESLAGATAGSLAGLEPGEDVEERIRRLLEGAEGELLARLVSSERQGDG